jgi:serine/threonine protein kinase
MEGLSSLSEFRKARNDSTVEEGGQGQVRPVQRRGKKYARKDFHTSEAARGEALILGKIAQAISKVGLTRHPHLPKLVVEEGKTLILEPWCNQKFGEYWTCDKAFDVMNLQRQLLCLAQSIAFLHGNEIKHKDLHDGNVLYIGNSVVVTDFGFSRHHQAESSHSLNVVRKAFFESPDHGSTRATDIFQLGLIFAKALLLTFSHDNSDLFESIFNNHKLKVSNRKPQSSMIPENFGKELRSPWSRSGCEELLASLEHFVAKDLRFLVPIVRDMISVEAEKRPTAFFVCEVVWGINVRVMM